MASWYSCLHPVLQYFTSSNDKWSPCRIKNTLKSWKEDASQFVQAAKKDPVFMWDKGVQNLLWLASSTCSVPFVLIQKTEEGPTPLLNLQASRGLHKWLTTIVTAILFLRCSILQVTLLDRDIWVENGHLTSYAGIFIMLAVCSIGLMIQIFTIFSFRKQIPAFYNAVHEFSRSFSRKHVGEAGILYLYKESMRMKLASLSVFSLIVTPFYVALLIYRIHDSPVVLASLLFTTSYNGRLALIFIDWLILVAGFQQNLALFFITLEPVISITLITTHLKSRRDIDWEIRRRYHIQMEILMKEHARILHILLPVAAAGAMTIAVTANWQLTTVHKTHVGSCNPCRYLTLSITSSSILGVAFAAFKFAERLRSESENLLVDLQTAVVRQATKLNIIWRDRSSSYPGGTCTLRRMFRRLPLRVRIYTFFWIRDGFGLTFVQEAIENTVNVVVMAKTKNVAKWLL